MYIVVDVLFGDSFKMRMWYSIFCKVSNVT